MKPHLDILLIADDLDDCARFRIAVDESALSIFIQTVTDGEEAFDYLEGRRVYADRLKHPVPDLVVLDLDMRLAGAWDFLAWRRAAGSFRSLPVGILSGFGYTGAIETALAMGADSFFVKPLEFEGWEAVVQQIWDLGMERSEPLRQLQLAAGGPDAQAWLFELTSEQPRYRITRAEPLLRSLNCASAKTICGNLNSQTEHSKKHSEILWTKNY